QLIEKEKITHELNIARDIQMNLMPTGKFEDPRIDVDFRCIPAMEVGGDYVDFININEDKKAVVMGDVSGKGVPAALLMVMLRTLIRSFAGRELSPAALMEKVNNLLVEDIDPKVFATLFYGIVDLKKKTCRYCNAGHNYPVLLRKSKIIEELNTNDVVLGFFSNYVFHEDTVRLTGDDLLCLYTDGVIEAQDNEGKIFTTERFYKILEKSDHNNVFNNVIEEITAYSGGDNFSDDLSIAYVRLIK
ncbi:MAG: PP2C family protein-serine/threonine phosphatase, partial [Candidatus Muiribacteriaceae bacterium]